MLSTPRPSACRPSLGEPCRAASRHRVQSPGAQSVDSLDVPLTASPRRRTGSSTLGTGSSVRHSIRATPARLLRDPRPIGDKAYAAQCARGVVEILVARGYGRPISHEKLLRDPSTRDFFDIFRFLMAQVDPQLELEGRLEDEVPAIMRRLKYPVEVNRSKLQAISGPNTWPQLLAVLDWLASLVRISDELIEPVATCELGLVDAAEAEHEMADHLLLGSLQENYIQYLGNSGDNSDEERLRHIYEERLGALQGEIERLEAQHGDMEQRLQDFRAEHARLLELRREPPQLEAEAEKLRGVIQTAEARVQQLEDEIAHVEVEEHAHRQELEELQDIVQQLTEQVESQAYSKKDIERLKCERGQLRHVRQDLQADLEKIDQDIWELGMKESKWTEAVGRLVRQVNESVEPLQDAEAGAEEPNHAIHVDLSEPTEALAARDFSDLRKSLQRSIASNQEATQQEEAALHEVLEEQRVVQEDLSERERESRRLKVRFEQLSRMREEYRQWSAEQLDDAQRTAEATEDAVHAVSIGAAVPSLRDAAEVDKLRLALSEERARFANEKAQLQEQIRRDEERLEEHRRRVLRELDAHEEATRELLADVEAVLDAEPLVQMQGLPRARHFGGC